MTQIQSDAVDAVLEQWRNERPDLDVSPMAIIGRLGRCAALLRPQLEGTFAEFDINSWEFDVLATLRRSGKPFRLTPTALFSSMMITSGTMTHRLQSLENRALIKRLPNPADARSMLVQLSASGLKLIDRAVAAHVENERRILAPLKASSQAALNARLTELLAVLEELNQR